MKVGDTVRANQLSIDEGANLPTVTGWIKRFKDRYTAYVMWEGELNALPAPVRYIELVPQSLDDGETE